MPAGLKMYRPLARDEPVSDGGNVDDSLPWVGLHTGGWKECAEEGVAEMCDELTAIPIPHPSVPLRGGRQRS